MNKIAVVGESEEDMESKGKVNVEEVAIETPIESLVFLKLTEGLTSQAGLA